MAMVLNRIFRRFSSPIFGLLKLLAAFHTFWNQQLVLCHRPSAIKRCWHVLDHQTMAPAGIWPVVRTDMMPKSVGGGEGDYNMTVIIRSKQSIYNIQLRTWTRLYMNGLEVK